MRSNKFSLVLAVLIGLLVVIPVAAGKNDLTAVCANKAAFVFGPDGDPLPGHDQPLCSTQGVYVVVSPWSDTVSAGETKRFDTWADAYKYASEFTGGSIWFEPAAAPATATPVPAAAAPTTASGISAQQASGQVSLNWTNWCAGVSPLVFTGGGILNAGPLTSLSPPCSGGAVVMLEPWRPGCTAPHATNPNCNVGKAWLASDWSAAANWLVSHNWPEGSLWYRPADSVGMGQIVSTCVKALVPPGTAINTVEGYDPCEGVDRPPEIAVEPTPTASPTPSPTPTPIVIKETVEVIKEVVVTATPEAVEEPIATKAITDYFGWWCLIPIALICVAIGVVGIYFLLLRPREEEVAPPPPPPAPAPAPAPVPVAAPPAAPPAAPAPVVLEEEAPAEEEVEEIPEEVPPEPGD